MTNSNRLVKLTVVGNASQKNVIGKKDWAAIKNQSGYVTLEATTSPRNSFDEWKRY